MAANYNQRNVDQLRVLDTVSTGPGGQGPSSPALGWKETLHVPGAEVLASYTDGSMALVTVTATVTVNLQTVEFIELRP